MDPSFQDAYFDLTTALMATGAFNEALATFRALHKAGVEDRIGLANNLSWELYLAGRYRRASDRRRLACGKPKADRPAERHL